MAIRFPRFPRRALPSSTRAGNRVDNPPLEHTDTARLRILLQDETQDWRHKIEEVHNEVARIVEKHSDRWDAYFRKEPTLADHRDIRNLWVAFAAVCSLAITLIVLLIEFLGKK